MYIDIKTSIIWYQKLLLLTSTVLKSESSFLISKKGSHSWYQLSLYDIRNNIFWCHRMFFFLIQVFDFKSVDWNAAKILRHSINYDIKQMNKMLNW